MKFFPEGDGGNAVILLENGVKLKIIVIAALLGDLFQRQIGTANKGVRVFEPHLNDVLFRGNARPFFEQKPEMVGAIAHCGGYRFDVDGGHKIFVEIVDDVIEIGTFLRRGVRAVVLRLQNAVVD